MANRQGRQRCYNGSYGYLQPQQDGSFVAVTGSIQTLLGWALGVLSSDVGKLEVRDGVRWGKDKVIWSKP